MGADELRRALNEASAGPERDFTGTWAQGRKVRRRRQTAQGLGVVAVAAAAVGAFALGGGNLLGEDAMIEPPPPATQTPTTEEVTDEATTEADTTEATEEATEEATGGPIVLPNPCDEPIEGLVVMAGDAIPPVVDRAQEVLDLAAACDLDGLIALAEEQRTVVDIAEMPDDPDEVPVDRSPAEVFAGDEGRQRAHVLATLLTNYPPELGGRNDGPPESARWPGAGPDQWDELVELGVATPEDVESYREAGEYLGWGIFIEDDGTWSGMLEQISPTEGAASGEVGLPGPGDPLPNTVEEYVRVYLAAGMAGDDVLLERMGTDGAIEASVTWTDLPLLLQDVQVSDGVDAGQASVRVLAEGPYAVTLTVDRAAVEAGDDDGVLHGEQADAPASMTTEEYADLAIETWVAGWAGMHSVPDAVTVLDQVPTAGEWVRSDSSEDGEVVLVTYVNDAVEGELVLTVDPVLVELREYRAIVEASFSGDPIGVPTTHPCDEPWSQVPSPGAGGASDNAALAALDLLDLAAACNVDGLIAQAEREGTVLSLGSGTPADAFAGEQGRERALALARLLSAYPPALETGDEGQTVSVWPGLPLDRLDELVELGLYSQEEIDAMRDNGAYTGWRIVIDEDGSWLSMVEGE